MSIIEKFITKSNSHHIKTQKKQFNLDSLEKKWDLSTMLLVNSSKNEQIVAKFKNNFPVLKTIYFTVTIVIR